MTKPPLHIVISMKMFAAWLLVALAIGILVGGHMGMLTAAHELRSCISMVKRLNERGL